MRSKICIEVDAKKLLGFVSDAHGNPFGLLSTIIHLRENAANQIFFLGDAVGYLPMACDVLSILEKRHITCLMGNHEAMLCDTLPLDSQKEPLYRLNWLKERLSENRIHQISLWPKRLEINAGNRRILLLHGSPWGELTDYVYPDDDLSRFEALDLSAVFLGHTHRPFCRTLGRVLVVNVGSCGLPRDIGNMASAAIYDPQTNEAKILRVRLDIDKIINSSEEFYELSSEIRSRMCGSALNETR